jgi:nicotinamide-nucleotide amidase
VVDAGIEAQIEARSRLVAERLKRPYADFAPGVRKQAAVPEGAVIAGLVGTAPALVLELDGGRVAVVLPGPPRELQPLWAEALETEPLRRLVARAQPPERRIMRFYGVSESALAQALDSAGGDGNGVEMTICARETEMHVDLFVTPGAEERADTLETAFLAPLRQYLFSRTEDPIEALILDRCRERGLTLATAESCSGGLVAGRLTSVPGSSDVFAGGIVSYANRIKESELGVPEEVLAEYGAVSRETALAMARGARERLGVDVAVSVTGVAGPGGGTEEKPVGLVYLCASGPGGERERDFVLPGDRESIRLRATVGALHLVHALVSKT